MTGEDYRVASFPGRGNRNNPYIDLFYDALQSRGTLLTATLRLEQEWIEENAEQLDAIHLHWPEWSWRNTQNASSNLHWRRLSRLIPGAWRIDAWRNSLGLRRRHTYLRKWVGKLYGILSFRHALYSAKSHKVKIIWTFHNAEPHEGEDWLDTWGLRFTANAADLIICHSDYARNVFQSKFRHHGRVVVMPHGNYVGYYPEPSSRRSVLLGLGLDPNLPMVAAVGMMRDYKGLDVAAEALLKFDGRVQFVCAGMPHPDFDLKEFERSFRRLKNAKLIARFVTDQEFADIAHASEALLLPYRKSASSGALLAALTLGRGVIASDLPYFREILKQSGPAGMLVSPDNTLQMSEAIEEYLALPLSLRRVAAFELGRKFDWEKVIKPVAEIFDEWKSSQSDNSLDES